MGTVLFFDMFSGISGDMCAGAFLDLGLNRKELRKVLSYLPVKDEFHIRIKKKEINGIAGTDFSVVLKSRGHSKHCRSMKEIKKMLANSGLPQKTKDLSIKIFTMLAKAEGKIHNTKWTDVHFHEVGAVDSIVDIVTIAFATEYLNVARIFSSPLRFGTGFVNTRHGKLPVPAPAVLELARGLQTVFTDIPMELTTPTGAAVIKAMVASPGAALPECTILKTGYGCGKNQISGIPNMLRIIIGAEESLSSPVIEFQTDIDDSTPETIGYLFDVLFKAGAIDCSAGSIMMKKGRPGYRITVLANANRGEIIKRVLFSETTTFGIRELPVRRTRLKRDILKVTIPEGSIRCKIGYLGKDPVTISPEYEDCRIAAQKTSTPLKHIYQKAVNIAEKIINKKGEKLR